jgi:dihydroflavonol-4-reductase
MKVFITGGTGFIGSYFVKRMAQTDHELHCLCRKTSDVSCLEEAGAEKCVGDVTDKDSLLEGMKGCDWVVNMANIYSFWEPDMNVFTDVNVEGTRNVMESALQTGASKVVHLSTVVVYDGPHECSSLEKNEYMKNLKTEYARTKYLADSICWELYAKESLPLVMIYPGGVLGAGDNKPTGEYIETVVKSKSPFTVFEDCRDTYVHVQDVAESILRALEKPDNIGERYPVGNYTMTIGEMNELISEISGAPVPKISLPDSMVRINAVFTTWLANALKKPPILGISKDSIGNLMDDHCFDGSKTERELDLEYTPIRVAVEEEVRAIKEEARA